MCEVYWIRCVRKKTLSFSKKTLRFSKKIRRFLRNFTIFFKKLGMFFMEGQLGTPLIKPVIPSSPFILSF